jgi:probable HAF family extracellular repeat protein
MAMKRKASFAVFFLVLTTCATAQVIFNISDLGPNLRPVAINARGQVAATGQCLTCGFYLRYHALLWTPGSGLRDLGTLPGGTLLSFAYGMNDLGQVVGLSDTAVTGYYHAFLWSQEAGMQDLETLPGGNSFSVALGTNDRGSVLPLWLAFAAMPSYGMRRTCESTYNRPR